ncbi:MAG: DNA translocase FtsK 4TM domain-containing protein, partial [Pararhizobium sp.]
MQTGNSAMLAGRHGRQAVPGYLRRPLTGVAGLAVFAALALAVLALATWNVDDPSFSYANGNVPTNALGYPGAVFADLTMQFFGIGAVIGLLPGVFWGLFLFRNRYVDRKLRRGLSWFAGTVLAAAVLCCIPVPKTWPLPSGLGGVFGDMVLKVPGLVLGGYPHGLVATLIGVVLIVPATMLLFFGAGLTGRMSEAEWWPAADEEEFDADEADDEEDDDEDGAVAFGLLTHWWLTGRAHVRRLTGALPLKRRAAPVEYEEPYDFNEDDFQPLGAPAAPRREAPTRREPSFETAAATPDVPEISMEADMRVRPASRPPREPRFVDEIDYGAGPDVAAQAAARVFEQEDDEEDDWQDEAPADPAPAPVSARVAAPAARPQPVARPQRAPMPGPAGRGGFQLPSIELLEKAKSVKKDASLSTDALEQNARMLEGVLEDFGVKGEIIHVRPGPVVTLYELEPAPGIKSSRVIGLADDIARSMSAIAARVAVVPGRNAIGIELPNRTRETVYLSELVASQDFASSKGRLALTLGKTIGGEPVIADLAKMPHLLVAGTTGSGKSVAINTMILSLLYRLPPEKCRLIMIDPKMLELSVYDGIPHLLSPVVTDPKKAVVALKWTVREMEERYKKMSKIGVRNVDG